MGKIIDRTLRMRMDNVKPEVPKYWREVALDMYPDVDIEGMRNVLRGKSHDEDLVRVFEEIVIKKRAMDSVTD